MKITYSRDGRYYWKPGKGWVKVSYNWPLIILALLGILLQVAALIGYGIAIYYLSNAAK